MESGTVHQIIQAHKRISSGNNNNEGTSGGAVSSIVSFPWPFHHRLISIIICSWLNSWGSAAALGPAAQLRQSRRWQWHQQKCMKYQRCLRCRRNSLLNLCSQLQPMENNSGGARTFLNYIWSDLFWGVPIIFWFLFLWRFYFCCSSVALRRLLNC